MVVINRDISSLGPFCLFVLSQWYSLYILVVKMLLVSVLCKFIHVCTPLLVINENPSIKSTFKKTVFVHPNKRK